MEHLKGIIVVIAVLMAGFVWAGEPVDCAYRTKSGKADQPGSTREYKNCGTNTEGKIVLSRKHLGRLYHDKYGLATVFVLGRYYYVKRNGLMLPVVGYDNWADDYSEGLVRSLVDGKIAFYDRSFKQIIPPRYDWATPFDKGKALVCTGCKAEAPDEEGHAAMTGGAWGYINKKGETVVPVTHTRAEAEQMK